MKKKKKKKKKKYISEFFSENFQFLVVNFSIYLNRLVFAMRVDCLIQVALKPDLTVSFDTVSGQRRFISNCAHARTDQGPHCSHMTFGSFFCNAFDVIINANSLSCYFSHFLSFSD